MSSRVTAVLAIGLAAVAFLLTAAALIFALLGNADGEGLVFTANDVGGFVLGLTYPLVGALVALRRSRNPVGWIYLAVGVSQGLSSFAAPYSEYGLITVPGSLPFADAMAWLEMWAWAPGLTLFVSISLLLFPDGHHLSPRWRVVTLLAGVSMALLIVPMAVVAWSVPGIDLVRINAGTGDEGLISRALPLQTTGLVVGVMTCVASLASLVLRWRRSQGIEREQLKWLAFAASVAFPFLIVTLVFPEEASLALIVLLVVPLVPIAVGIAILRYRLFEIDRIINRTLVYVPMTAVLAGIYTASVALTQRVFVAVTGEKSDGAVVFTTLVVVILFTPVKNALQAAVDRRFKEVPDPMAPLAQLADLFDTRVWAPDATASLRRLLDVSVAAFGASGGSISLAGISMAQSGGGAFEAELTAAAGDGATRVAIAMGPRPNGQPYTDADRRVLEPAIEAVARALAGS
jgi:hypothetical protein